MQTVNENEKSEEPPQPTSLPVYNSFEESLSNAAKISSSDADSSTGDTSRDAHGFKVIALLSQYTDIH